MQVAVLGFGSQGLSAFEYWTKLGHDVTICDKSTDIVIPDGTATQIGDNYLDGLEKYDLLVRSPSVHPHDIAKANPSVDIQSKVTTNTNEFFKVCPTKNTIGVTGTKGKGTTSTLIARMLEAAGHRVHLGGNIGTPPLEMLKEDIQADDWVVLELANFQLIDLKYSPKIGVCLMITPEHLDWHKNFDEYVTAKSQLFQWQSESDTAIFFAQNEFSKSIASSSKGRKIPYFEPPGAHVENNQIVIDSQSICDVADVKLLGAHNWENACAAVTAAWQITQDTEAIRSVVTSFGGLEHRLEFVRELDGVTYYNDSFGTTPETAIVALESFAQPKVAIVGGSDKGVPFDDMADAIIRNNVHVLIAIGDTGPKIAEIVRGKGGTMKIIESLDTMPEIVAAAREHARSGDVVLLSTGCASFGLFENYKDRGEQFKQAVQALA
jgi:UDP-N-acetylmuramoylalanine--D-glutamate ligase